MLASLRFRVYRELTALVSWIDLKTQRVFPLEAPGQDTVRFQPYADAFPDMPVAGIYHAESFPPWEHAAARVRRINAGKVIQWALRLVAPPVTPPVPADEDAFLAAVYPRLLRLTWPKTPHASEPLKAALRDERRDVVAELAVRGPYASYLRAATDAELSAAAVNDAGAHSAADANRAARVEYVMDTSWMLAHVVQPGLVRPGGKALLACHDGVLRTLAIERSGVADRDAQQAQDALLAGLNEDLITFRHNLCVHLATTTSFGLATTNHLGARHPIRRLLHPCFQTLLIGNHEVATFQLSGRHGFAARIFSHDHRELAVMAGEYLRAFEFWNFEPPTQFEQHGTAKTPFDYPYRDNTMQIWEETSRYVGEYLALYYDDDAALRLDTEVAAWLTELDLLLPNGVHAPEALSVDWMTRLCATLIHLSTVEHDYLNNVSWNYSTLGWILPTVVPESGERMDQRRALDLIATIIGTWKPYNMVLTMNLDALALDEAAARIMHAWIDRLARIQAEMDAGPRQPWLSYPANLNPSVSD